MTDPNTVNISHVGRQILASLLASAYGIHCAICQDENEVALAYLKVKLGEFKTKCDSKVYYNNKGVLETNKDPYTTPESIVIQDC